MLQIELAYAKSEFFNALELYPNVCKSGFKHGTFPPVFVALIVQNEALPAVKDDEKSLQFKFFFNIKW